MGATPYPAAWHRRLRAERCGASCRCRQTAVALCHHPRMTLPRGEMVQSRMRVGDAERDACVAALIEHHLHGRLTVEELDRRQRSALAAVTTDVHLPLLGAVHLSTVLVFDLGVYLLVVGAVMLILISLAHQSLRSQRKAV